MRVAVDGWRINGVTGVARYISNVVRGWASLPASSSVESITIITPRPIDRDRVQIPDHVEEQVVPSGARQTVWQNTVLNRHCDADVLWCPAYVAPVRCPARIVVTTHDATNAIHPELYGRMDRLFYRQFYAYCARRSELVITNNRQTSLDIHRHYRVPQAKIRIVPLAPAEVFRKVEPEEGVVIRSRLLGDQRPYLLSVGKISVRRNVPRVIEAFARLRARLGCEHRLVVVGKNGLDREIPAIAADLGLGEHCVHLGYVTDEELLHLYAGATAFVTAATYEGNSFTTLEAQATGAPVIIPDVPGMREMTGGNALVLPSVTVEEICTAMERLIIDEELRATLAQTGLAHAGTFSWARTSEGILSVLEEAGSKSRRVDS
jgi:glycosyltransferase involved in cell wall biosynthesis